VRFGGRLAVSEDVGAACGACLVPTLVLQPLVENAVKHGVASMLEGGVVKLEARCARGRLWVTVENPFDPEQPPAGRNGLGLVNVRNRLKARYDDTARLSSTITGNSFRVELSLPCGRGAAM
jgi:two-component system sensor histidine kinase AlgZ